MSHVDEGMLHAYLDGALDALPAAEAKRVREHLAVCETCRAHLEEERTVREEAAAILGGVPLDVGDLPPFEEVRARARADTARPGLRLQRMAWAASVVLAAGTGYLLRGGVLPTPPSPRVESPSAGASVVDEARGNEAALATGEPEEEAAEPPTAAAAPSPMAREVDASGTAVGPSTSQDVSPAFERRAGGGDVDREAQAPKAATTSTERDTARSGRPPATPAEMWAAARQSQVRPAGAIAPVSSFALADSLVSDLPRVPLEEEIRSLVAPAGTSAPGRRDVAGSTPGSLAVPGLAVLSVTWLEDPELAGAVRVLQRLEDGDTLELVHLPAGVDPSFVAPVGEGRTQALVPRGEGWLVVRATASAEVLSALVRRLEGGR